MVWSAETLKIVARQWPDFSTFPADQIENEVDACIASLPDHHAASTNLSMQEVELQQLDIGVSVSVDAKNPGCDVCAVM